MLNDSYRNKFTAEFNSRLFFTSMLYWRMYSHQYHSIDTVAFGLRSFRLCTVCLWYDKLNGGLFSNYFNQPSEFSLVYAWCDNSRDFESVPQSVFSLLRFDRWFWYCVMSEKSFVMTGYEKKWFRKWFFLNKRYKIHLLVTKEYHGDHQVDESYCILCSNYISYINNNNRISSFQYWANSISNSKSKHFSKYKLYFMVNIWWECRDKIFVYFSEFSHRIVKESVIFVRVWSRVRLAGKLFIFVLYIPFRMEMRVNGFSLIYT